MQLIKFINFLGYFYECIPCLTNGNVGTLREGAFYFYVFTDSKTVYNRCADNLSIQ